MSNQGIRGYYQLTSTIEEQLRGTEFTNTVSRPIKGYNDR